MSDPPSGTNHVKKFFEELFPKVEKLEARIVELEKTLAVQAAKNDAEKHDLDVSDIEELLPGIQEVSKTMSKDTAKGKLVSRLQSYVHIFDNDQSGKGTGMEWLHYARDLREINARTAINQIKWAIASLSVAIPIALVIYDMFVK